MNDLAPRQELRRLESIVAKALRLHLEAAKALQAIRDRKLYLGPYDSFEAYCRERWGISRQHAHRLCDYATVADNLSPFGDIPLRESHARPLATLTAGQQRRAWLDVRSLPKLTAAAIESVCLSVRRTPAHGSIENSPEIDATDDLSPLNWFGGKSKLAKEIVRLLPRHDTYCEPYFGGGAVLFAKAPSLIEVVNDRSDGVVNFFRCLRDARKRKELQRRLTLTPYSRSEHAYCKANPVDADPVETARRFFVRVRQSYSCVIDDTWGRTLAHRNKAAEFMSKVDQLHLAAERLRNVQIENRDGLELLREIDKAGVTAYLDPTYLPETRTRNGIAYEHEMTEADHAAMLETILRWRKARCVVSGYPSDMYAKALRKWTRYEFSRTINAAATTSKPRRTECVWVN